MNHEYTPTQIVSHIWYEADNWPETPADLYALIELAIKFDREHTTA